MLPAMVIGSLLWGLLLLSGARTQDGDPGFQPSFIYMSGSRVTASLAGTSADVFSLSVADNETGMFPLEDCRERNRTGDWSLYVTFQGNVSRVTVLLTRHLQICTSNHTGCCVEALCLVTALRVTACQDSMAVARLSIQAEIYANASSGNEMGNSETSDNVTVIPNQVFQPLGSCPCNLTAGACDIRCCCDQECTPEVKQLFSGSCFSGVFGGDVNPPFDQLCSVQTGINTPDWFPFLCVQSSLNNTPFLGYFYQGSVTSSKASSFMVPFQTIPGRLFSGYKQGDPIMTLDNEYFAVPQPFLAGQCARDAPVAFLRNFAVECLTTCMEGKSMLPDVTINSGTGVPIKLHVTYEKKTTDLGSCTSSECRNVTFAANYTIIWEGKRIIEMKVSILSGDICSEDTLRQRFTVNFVSINATSTEEWSGNPGYQVGKPIRAASLDSSVAITTLNLWKPDGLGLCTSASPTPILFGLNAVSGCVLEVDLKENCSQLRENVTDKLNSLVQVNHVGKRGNSNSSIPDDWVEIIRLDTFGPSSNASVGVLKGMCPGVPAHLNIQILTADVGAVEGVPQQEILGVQISFSTITWQVQCPITCEDKAGSLLISAAVQFIKIPAQPPVPKTRFQINYTEYDCKRNDVCWPELFYPLTRFYAGEPYSRSLAKGLVLAFLILLAVMLSDPVRRIYEAWNKT
ncbi:tectonic-2 [Eublepharis macularius]|uniref:Tectonic-2 n=1 Tax=Eublepharis macularius TaxID=481883 RepID=A0AA97LEQ7_EUBMA|nr:tectonic-2 [Eublepharis macularius]